MNFYNFNKLWRKEDLDEKEYDIVFARFSEIRNGKFFNIYEDNLIKFCNTIDFTFFFKNDSIVNEGNLVHKQSIFGTCCRSLYKKNIITNN